MKKCNKCLIEKDESEFPRRGVKTYFLCKPCKKEYDRNYYHNNKDLTKKRIASNKTFHKRRDLIFRIKSVPCKDCNIQYKPWQMQFDHLKDKKFNISDIGRHQKLEVLLDEIKKCDIVCANCHADRTYKRLQSRIGKVW